jgi:phosphoglycolate phosphatase
LARGLSRAELALMPLKAVLFDLDGTLVDSASDLMDALNRLLAECGLSTLSVDQVKGMIGDGVLKLIERGLAASGGKSADAPALLPRFLEFYEGNAARFTCAYPGAQEALGRLGGMGLRLGVVTNKPYAASCEILDSLNLSRFFGAVIAGDTLATRKPHPAPLLHAAQQLGVSSSETLMVGDNHHDINAARGAGMLAVAVTWGYSHVPHSELGADGLIDHFDDLFPILES